MSMRLQNIINIAGLVAINIVAAFNGLLCLKIYNEWPDQASWLDQLTFNLQLLITIALMMLIIFNIARVLSDFKLAFKGTGAHKACYLIRGLLSFIYAFAAFVILFILTSAWFYMHYRFFWAVIVVFLLIVLPIICINVFELAREYLQKKMPE